jgi:shikimate dehydrogenase
MSTLTLCGSLSRHPGTLGAAMHLAGYRALGLAYTYVPFRVTDLAGAVTGVRALGIRGCAVSMPYKVDVLPLLDELDPLAARIGAVNTVVNDGGRLTGHNTDAIGAVRALEEENPIADASVLLLGAGGAARAIAYALQDRGARVTIGNRTADKGRALAAATGATVVALDDAIAGAGGFDVVVNATSKGMVDVDPESPLPPQALHAGQVVMDIVAKPIETALIKHARARGAVAIHGGRMLLHQAARQFELYTGRSAPLEAMEAALLEQIG